MGCGCSGKQDPTGTGSQSGGARRRSSGRRLGKSTLRTKKQRACQQRVMQEEMHLFKKGKLYSGNGRKVKNRQQAIAIGLSVARQKCVKSRSKAAKSRTKKSRSNKRKSSASRRRH